MFENFLAEKRARMADKLIPEHSRTGRVLDLGCGVIPFFLMNTKFKEKYGLGTSVDISIANEQNIILRKIDLETADLPFEDNFFDVITMLAVVEHIKPDKLAKVFEEIKRILKPSGRFILTTPSPWSDKLLVLMAKLRLVSREEFKEHKGVYGHVLITHYLDEAGFRRDKINCGYFELFLNSWAYADK